MNKNILFLQLFLFLIISNIAHSGMKEIEFSELTLDNGLHVILHQDNSLPIVSLSITYYVGSKNERDDRTGFAHYMEHLMFEGSKNIARGDFFKLAQHAGGDINAATGFDKTYYFMQLPSNQLELGLWMESERLLHLEIDSTGVETQRQVIKEERSQMYDNQPYGSWIEKMFSKAFIKHPYNWVPIGSVQYIDQATLEEFQEFHSIYYVPNNAVLSIAGDIKIEETKKLVELYFGDIPRGNKPIQRPDIKEPKQESEIRDTIYDQIQLPAVIHGYRMPERGSSDAFALEMLTNLLAQGESSRLYRELVDNQEIALIVQAAPFQLEDYGLFIVLSLPNMGIQPEVLEDAIIEQIKRIQNEGISEDEFQKLRNAIESNFINQVASLQRIAINLADYHIFYNDAGMINRKIDTYMNVTKEDIIRVANEYLVPENRVVLYYLPKSN